MEEDEEEKGIIARREDEVLSDRIRTLLSLSFSIAPQLSVVQISGRLALL